MTEQENSVAVLTFAGKSFRIQYRTAQAPKLLEAAELLRKRIDEAQIKDRFATVDQVAIIAGLNLAGENLSLAGSSDHLGAEDETRLERMRRKITTALQEVEPFSS